VSLIPHPYGVTVPRPPAAILVTLAFLVVSTAACSSGRSSAPSGAGPTTTVAGPRVPTSDRVVTSDQTIRTADGRIRTYRVVTPRSLPTQAAVPLLVALHGGVGSGRQFEQTSGFDDLAVRDGFVVVYPDGIEIGGASVLGRGHVWNGGRCCGSAARLQVDDVAFIRAVIDRVSEERRIDTHRVFAAGHSNGAIMAYRLACELSDRITAIGLQAGSIEVPSCAPHHPVSVIAVHGTADTNIPIRGGRGSGIAGIAFSSPVDAVTTFARLYDCGPSTTRRDPSNPDVSTERWGPCAAGSAVELVRVHGATHAWMGHPSPRPATGLAGSPYRDFDSTAAIWAFLAAHPRAS
jgi:polyhydroxybutyrate depolymerase